MTSELLDLGLSESDIVRFYRFVGDGPGECREWMGAKKKTGLGYGLFSWWVRDERGRHTRTILAHRLAYLLATGNKPVGHVCHTCDNPPCCKGAHLYDGTAVTNKDDAVRRRRHAFGTRVNTAKLTNEEVIAMRADWAAGGVTKTDLGRKYGVSNAMAGFIIREVNWRHLL